MINTDNTKFKDESGRYFTQSLFIEYAAKPEYAVYTLKEKDYEKDGITYPSLKRLYLEMEDIGEYEFATKYLYNWEQWERLQETNVILPHIKRWREELVLKLRSKGIKGIIQSSADSFQAQKWLADKGWVDKEMGRPSAKRKRKEKEELDNVRKSVVTDLERIRKANGKV